MGVQGEAMVEFALLLGTVLIVSSFMDAWDLINCNEIVKLGYKTALHEGT